MKGIKIIFAVCLALLGLGGAFATEETDAARAAARRVTTNTVTSNRQKSNTSVNLGDRTGISRQTNTASKPTQNIRERTTTPRTGTNVSTVSRTAVSRTTTHEPVSARNTSSNISTRAVTTGKAITQPTLGISRTATINRTTGGRALSSSYNQSRSATRQPTIQRAATARSGSTPLETVELRSQIMNSNNQECRDVYYKCMDEFCANKDSQLKRCACSSRLHEFDTVKKQLATAEEKMLDFSQRLLTVSMDAEDAAALNIATEGEIAFNQKDKSDSQSILNEISKKLNTTFSDESFDRNLTAISLSLNEDAAFDNVDSLMGASTTLKTGTELYAAALPVCREMAAEVCTPDQLQIVESGYQMQIEQDCNTVKKSYQSQADQARNKVRENSALLDMSRLNVYQDRNSDDILTCKKKMLDMLTNTSVCGPNLVKCLDTTGQYIDPATGEAFLTVNLADLNYLITRPSGDQTWVGMPGNEKFVSYLNSKKQYLEPATEHCQDISDYVWDEFIEDALSQIKLAQDAKLEEVRQSCTTLTTQCLSDTAKTLEDFDARALSTFGVIADVTVNSMCKDVTNACTALLQATDGNTDWIGGMTEIATDKTYDTIIKTCREVGRACIIQACKSISGNFGLCENIETSVNRKSIINRTACWQEVVDCVADAGTESINNIMNQLADRKTISNTATSTSPIQGQTYNSIPAYSFYKTLYYTEDDTQYNYSDIINSAYSDNNNKVDTISDMCITDYSSKNAPEDEKYKIEKDENGKEVKKEIKEGIHKKNCVYDICMADSKCNGPNDASMSCKACRIAEKIWGNCEVVPSTTLPELTHNRIKKPINDQDSTLLYWFALNTGTDKMADSCRDTSCGPGYMMDPKTGNCYPSNTFGADGERCVSSQFTTPAGNGEFNCCNDPDSIDGSSPTDEWGNCCKNGHIIEPIYNYDASGGNYFIYPGESKPETNNGHKLCLPRNYNYAELVMTFNIDSTKSENTMYPDGNYALICMTNTKPDSSSSISISNAVVCSGRYLIIEIEHGIYYQLTSEPANMTTKPSQYYHRDAGQQICTLTYDTEQKKLIWKTNIGGVACNTTDSTTWKDTHYKIDW